MGNTHKLHKTLQRTESSKIVQLCSCGRESNYQPRYDIIPCCVYCGMPVWCKYITIIKRPQSDRHIARDMSELLPYVDGYSGNDWHCDTHSRVYVRYDGIEIGHIRVRASIILWDIPQEHRDTLESEIVP